MNASHAPADTREAAEPFLANLAYAGALGALVSVTATLLAIVARSGLDTPPLLLLGLSLHGESGRVVPGVGPGRIVDEGVLEQGQEDEGDAQIGPDVNGLGVGDGGQRLVDGRRGG